MHIRVVADGGGLELGGHGTLARMSEDVAVWVPGQIAALIVDDATSVKVELEVGIQPRTSKPVITRMTLTGELPNDVLRSMGMGTAFAETVRMAATRYRRGDGDRWSPDQSAPVTESEVRKLLQRRQRTVSDLELRRAADAYRDAKQRRLADPLRVVATAIGSSRATAHRRIQMARQHGLIDQED